MRKLFVMSIAVLTMSLSGCNLFRDLLPALPKDKDHPGPERPKPEPNECGLEGKLVKMCGRGVFGELWIVDAQSGTLLQPVSIDSNIVLPAVVLTEGTLVRYDARRIEKTRCIKATNAGREAIEGYKAQITCFGVTTLRPEKPTPPPPPTRPTTQSARGKVVNICGNSILGGGLWIAIQSNSGREVLQPLKAANGLPNVTFKEGDEVKLEFEKVARTTCDANAPAAGIMIYNIAKI